MFVKNLEMPINLMKAEALGRIAENHPCMPELKTFIKTLRSGYNGEKTIHYYLTQIPTQRFLIFHDLRLPYGDGYFQIDILLLSSRIILMLDGKNHSGKLNIDKDQMIQEYMDSRIIYENPVSQANRHNVLLKYFLEKHKIPSIPIESLAVITKSSTELIINPDYKEAERKVCRASDIIRKIEEYHHRYKRECTDHKTIEKIKKLLLKNHTPLEINILEKFSVLKSDILPGVQCPNCKCIPMNYKRKNWICPLCKFISHDAHINAIADYFLLINSYFSNPEIRRFLHLPSSRATTYLLSLLHFQVTGATKDRIYHIPTNFHLIFSPIKQTL